jgi:hypothetical protein
MCKLILNLTSDTREIPPSICRALGGSISRNITASVSDKHIKPDALLVVYLQIEATQSCDHVRSGVTCNARDPGHCHRFPPYHQIEATQSCDHMRNGVTCNARDPGHCHRSPPTTKSKQRNHVTTCVTVSHVTPGIPGTATALPLLYHQIEVTQSCDHVRNGVTCNARDPGHCHRSPPTTKLK